MGAVLAGRSHHFLRKLACLRAEEIFYLRIYEVLSPLIELGSLSLYCMCLFSY